MALYSCPDCGHQVSNAAPSCPGCGRPIAVKHSQVATAAKAGGIGCGGMVVFGLLLVLGFCGYVSHKTSESLARAREEAAKRPPTPPPTTESAAQRAANMLRLVREDHAADDNARAFIFKSALKSAGQRCDAIQAATMAEVGVWRVRCAPGYLFVFKFGPKGELLSAVKVD